MHRGSIYLYTVVKGLRKCEIPSDRYQKWLEELQVRINKLDITDWTESYKTVFRLTESRKLRSFEYHLRMRDIMSNSKLFKMGLKAEQNCRFCPCKEDILHLFWHCPWAQDIWTELRKWVQTKCGLKITMHPVYVIFNLEVNWDETTPDIVWLILLITKQYLYAAKCLDVTPRFENGIEKIKDIENIEYNIAQDSNKLHFHYDKWSRFAARRPDSVNCDRKEDAIFI